MNSLKVRSLSTCGTNNLTDHQQHLLTEYIVNRQTLLRLNQTTNTIHTSYPTLIINQNTIDSCRPKKRYSRMKKLNIFNPSGKRKSTEKGLGGPEGPTAPSGDTLNRIVNLKAEQKRKWELEQEEFQRRKREHELQLIDIERKEVQRREEEVRRRNEDLDEVKRKHKMVQDAVKEQIKMLTGKLEEYKTSHQKEEESLENEIEDMEDQLMSVKSDLERRVEELGQTLEKENSEEGGSVATLQAGELTGDSLAVPSAPRDSLSAEELDNVQSPPYSMYPAIPPTNRNYESSKILHLNNSNQVVPQAMPRQSQVLGTSIGSSPLSSCHSASSRSATPKTEVSDIDYSV